MKKLFTGVLIILLSSLAVADGRQSQLLNGTWQGVEGKGLAELPTEGWKDFNVPGKADSYGVGGAHYLWIRRQVEIPASWGDCRVFVRLNSARFNPHIYVDGKFIGQRMDGWTPFEVEITNAVKPGSTHWLQVRCQDKTATFVDDFILKPGQGDEALRGKILAPVGGYHFFFGTWDDVWLLSRPKVYVDDVVIIPSTRKSTLTVSGIVSEVAESGLWVEGKVLDKDRTVLDIPGSSVGEASKWEIARPFANAKYWSPENPHLYKLRLLLRKGKDGPVLDTFEERFGFKEFWKEGPDFYLNGVKRHLLASSCWPIGGYVQSREEVRKTLELIKAGNNVAFRYHTAPWPKRWVELADEVGVMIICETAVYTDQVGMYAYQDERFWKNFREHLKGLIKRDRNNASVIMWSIENEILFMGMDKYCPDLAKRLGDLGRFAKQLDPYHLIIFDGDLDPDGAADVIGLHYPHELPTYADWPNTADWLAKRTRTEAGGGMLGVRRRDFYWDRKKPLYIGEYLWVPQQDYSAGTIFFGDDAYLDRETYHNKAKLQAWIYQTIAYRRADVSGICPWSCFRNGVIVDELSRPFYEAQTELFRPVVAYLQNKDARFFAGDSVERTFDVFNDSPTDSNLSLSWKLSGSDVQGQEKFGLGAGGYKAVSIRFVAPGVNVPTQYNFESVLLADGHQVSTTKDKYTIEKRQPLKAPTGTKVLVYDPQETFYKNASSFDRISSLGDLKRTDVKSNILIVAPRATTEASDDQSKLRIGGTSFDAQDFIAYLKRGGKAIVLEQTTLDGFGLGLSVVENASTMTFALNAQHPILKGLTKDSLKFWRGDNYVTRYQISRPTVCGARAVIVSGGNRGLEYSGILEMTIGNGTVLFMQALIGEKFNVEPAAGRILANSLNYLAAKTATKAKALVLTDEQGFTEKLSALRLNYRLADGALKETDLNDIQLLILHGGGSNIIRSKDAIDSFLKLCPSNKIYWHCPEAKAFEALKSAIGADGLKIAEQKGPVAIRLRDHELLTGVSREDLLFTRSARGYRRAINVDASVIDRTVVPQKLSGPQQRIEAESLKLDAHIVKINAAGDAVRFGTKGTATGWITVPEPGMYMLALVAGSANADRSQPLVRVKVAGQIIGRISVTEEKQCQWPLLAELPAGRNKIEIAFMNGSEWGGGVELLLDALLVKGKAKVPDNVKILTLPAALVSISAGKGQLIIDNVRWDTNEDNITKAGRYASALFANLGTSFQPPQTEELTWLALGSFELVGESPYFEKTSNQITLRSNGTVAADFSCVKDAQYALFLKGYSTPVQGKYAVAEILIDGKSVDQKEISSEKSQQFEFKTVQISAGGHKLSISFINDAYRDGQDRNLFIDGLGFKEVTQKQMPAEE